MEKNMEHPQKKKKKIKNWHMSQKLNRHYLEELSDI